MKKIIFFFTAMLLIMSAAFAQQTGDCNPATNLTVDYSSDCMTAHLTWDEPVAKKSGSAVVAQTFFTPGDVPAVRRGQSASSATRSKTANVPFKLVGEDPTRAAWDLLWHFRVGDVEGSGGNFSPFLWEDKLYVAKWNANIHGLGNVNRFARSGNTWVYDGSITITGLTNMFGLNIEGFCTDGEFIYGATGGSIIWRINPATWTATNFVNVSGQYIDAVAYDVIDDCFWIAEYESYQVRKVSKAGAILKTLSTPNRITDIAWENNSDGTPYLWMLTGDNVNLHRWNLTTDAFQANAKTTSDVPGLTAVADAGAGLFTGLDITTGKIVMVGICEGSNLDPIFCYELGDGGEMCDPITNLTYSVDGNSVTLNWTAAPGSPTGYQISRNGNPLTTITTTTYTNNGVPDGMYTYGVKALYDEECFPQTVYTPQFMVGNLCLVEVIITAVNYGDDFSWIVTDDAGTILMGSGRQAPGGNDVETGTYTALIAGDATFTIWQHGTYYDNGVTLVIKVSGEQVYDLSIIGGSSGPGIPAGFIHNEPLECNSGDFRFNIYRNGDHIATTSKLFYNDNAYDSSMDHTWSVVVDCGDGTGSEPETITKQACGSTCETDPATNLVVEYMDECDYALLTWDEPGGKKAKITLQEPISDYVSIESGNAVSGRERTSNQPSLASLNGIPKKDENPVRGPDDYIRWTTGALVDALGAMFGAPSDFFAMTRYTPADLVAKGVVSGDIITKVKIGTWYVSTSTFEIHIFQGATSYTDPGDLKYQQMVTQTLANEAYNEVILTTPYIIDASQELWVGYRTITSYGYPAGVDGGPVVPGKGDVIYWGGEWQITSAWGFDNWNIETYVQTGNPNLAAAPTNVTLTPNGTALNGTLSWTNPTQTIGGNSLTAITKMVIQRNGAPYQEITTPTPTPGQAMTLPVTVTDAGYHTFSVYAVTSEGNGAGASATALFGDMCNIKFEKFCSFGDGWSGGTITVEVNGSTWTTVQFADGSYGEEYVLVPKGETKFYWNEGSYPCEHAVRIYDYADDLIFASPPAGNWLNCPGTGSGMETLSGLFYTFENNCGGTQYNIYRDGAYQATVTGSSYKDFTYVPNVGHTWSVRVLCPDGGESEPVTATEGACEGACPKPLNLQGEYTLYCDMVLTWDPPASKKAPKAASVAPEYIPVTEEEMLAHERAKYEEVANQKIFTEKPNKADYKQDGIERIILSKPTMNAPQNRNTIFSENFESANIPNLPAGWTRTNLNTTYPGWATDDYWWDAGNGKYAWDEWDLGSGARNAWMFSPSIQLTAGVAYSLSYMFIAGYDYGDGDNFEIKLAQQATVAAMNSGTEIYRVTNHYTGWGESGEYAVRQHTFTPTATGTYYLGFHVFTPSLDGYDVVIDDILVTTSGTPPIGNCEDVVIGTGTSQWYDPLPGWYGWNRNIILYEASEIGTAGDITELAFNISSASSNVSSNRTTKIYMMYTSASTLDAQYVWNTMKASATLVYDGDPTYTTTGWKIFELIAPFAYDGTQNLLVMVEGTGCTNSGSCAVQCRYTTKTNSHWYSRTDNSPPNDAALAGTRNSDRPNITFEICEPIIPVKYNVYRGEELLGSTYENTWTDDTNFDPFSPHTWLVTVACDEEGNESAPVTLFKDACACDTDLVTNLEGEYDKDCSILLTWEGLGGGSGVEGSISTPVSGNGSGAVAFDMVAGAQDVTITGFETEFGSTGTPTIYMYYRPGTACGNAVSSAGWTHIGDAQITVTAVNPARFYVALPAPVTIPAGETYGFYFGSSNGSIRYHNGGTTCGVTTVSGSNSDLTIKGGHGIVTSIPFTGSPFSERNFSGVMHYIVGGGGGSFNVYRGGDLITTTTETTYTDSGFDNTVENTWCVKVVCEEGGQSLPVCITMDPCIPCFPVTELTAVYNEDCCALIEWNAPTEKRIKITPPIATADELFIGDMSHLSHTISSARLDGFYTNIVEDPDRAPNNWIKWSAATNYDGIGSTAPPATFSVGARFIPSDLASFDVENGDILTKIRIYINEVASNTFTLKIYQGGTWSSNPGTLVHTQPVTGAVVGFNEITLTTPVTINTSQELWITYEIYQPGSTYPAGCDAGPGLNAKGNIMHWGGSWTTLSTLAPSLNYNWNIEAFVESGGGGSGKYNIYRNGELIAANHPESSYLDCDADIFLGHTWTITQVCQQTEFGESDPVSVSLLACACHPVQNLNVFYFNDCEGAELSWDAPEDPTGGKSIQVFIPEAKERSPEEIQRDAMKEQMENVTPALSMFAESNTGVPVFTIPTDRGDSRSQILWDNTNINVSTSGILSNYWAGNDNWIFSADDFDADGPWIIEKVHSKGFITTALALPTSFAIVIYSNVGNKPGVEIYRNNSIPVTNGEEPEIVLPTPFQLPGAGKYWITIAGHYNASVSTNAEISAYRWNIYYGSTSIGLQKHVYDKMGLISDIPPATWTPTPQVVPAAQSMWFKIEGQVGGELCPPVSNLNATQGSGQSVSLTWTAAPGSPSGYEILCDGNLLATVTTTSYTHPFVSAGSHNYCVRAVYPSSADCIPQSVCQTVVVTEDFGNCEGRIVGTGTSGSYQIPLNSYYSYSYTQQIFDESEIGDPGIITNIAFNYIHASALARQNQTIYLGYTTKTTFSGTTDWVPLSELIPVYTATSVTYNNSSTWFNFELQEPFKYEGGNLVVAFLNNNGTWDNTDLRFRTHAVTGNKTLHYYTDGSPINPASPPTASGMLTVRNNTRFVVCPDYAFNIYRDGVLIKDNWDNTVYQDFTPDMNPFLPHCWEVRAVCNGDGRPESDGVIVCLPPCKDISGWLVFGVVQAADGNNIVGATLDLVESSNAYVEYHTTSITDGRFEFDGVYKTTYTLTVEKAGYQVHTQTVIVEGHTNLGTIILYDIPYPPTGVVATEINDESSLIEWNLPATLPLSVGGIIGYRVWRFLEENQDNPGTWTTLNNNPIAAMEHIDNGWNGLATGIYMYAVRTCYSGGVESIPAYSNPLEKWNNVVYTINITCDNGANPAGAKVFLANKDGEHEYEGLSGNTGISFPTVRQGEYDLTITFAGFEDYTEELTIMENETHDVVLISIKYTVTFNVTKCGTEDPIADATIVFNGETITGYTVEAPAGTHSYTITKDEYATVSGKVTVVDQPITENVCISPVGVGDIEVGDFNLYPSPASFNITVERGAAIPATIELYNAMGMHINQYETTEIKFEINVAALSAGTYFIRVTEGDHIGVKSFVKK